MLNLHMVLIEALTIKWLESNIGNDTKVKLGNQPNIIWWISEMLKDPSRVTFEESV